MALSKICSVVPKPKQTFIGILLCFIVTARVCVPGRDCSPGLQDSDRPYGLPGWLWQTGLDPPTPHVLPDCWDLTHQPGRLPVRTKYCHQQKQAVVINTCVFLHLTCPAASVRPHKALEADATQSPNTATSPFLQFMEIPAMDSPRTWTERSGCPG